MEYSILAVELAARAEPGGPFGKQLRELITAQPRSQSPAHKQHLYHQTSRFLIDHFDRVQRGCWDYFDDSDRAESDFDMWCEGMTNAEGARTSPSNEPWMVPAHPLYLTFTMAFLIENGSPSDLTVRRTCDIPQARLWHRDSFRRVLQSVQVIRFEHVVSDVLYMIPNDDRFLLTDKDLDKDDFDYLRTVV